MSACNGRSADTDALRTLVDVAGGRASRELFVSQDLYDQEQEMVFGRAWLFLGHESQIPEPNDFCLSRMGEEEVILTRGGDGRIHALLNSCTHRGMKVCRYDSGNARTFTCPYHAWSFSNDGRVVGQPGELINVPGFKSRYHKELDKQAWGLIQVPSLCLFNGSIWGSWDSDAPPLETYLGGMAIWLRFALDSRDGRANGAEVVAGVQKWRTACNWKLSPLNFSGDVAHVVSHKSVDMVGIGPSGVGRRDDKVDGAGAFGWPDLGHGGTGWVAAREEDYEQAPSFRNFPDVSRYFEEARQKRRERRRGELHFQGKGSVFPNMSFHEEQPRTVIVAHPVGPTMTEFWRYYLVDKDAPDEVKDVLRRYNISYSGPAGLTESDDLENWSAATTASKGFMARRTYFNFQQGIGHSVPYDPIPGCVWAGHEYSEQNQVIWLKRWCEFMEGRTWPQLMHDEPVPGDVSFPLEAGDR